MAEEMYEKVCKAQFDRINTRLDNVNDEIKTLNVALLGDATSSREGIIPKVNRHDEALKHQSRFRDHVIGAVVTALIGGIITAIIFTGSR